MECTLIMALPVLVLLPKEDGLERESIMSTYVLLFFVLFPQLVTLPLSWDTDADNENNTRHSRGSDVGTISLVLRRCQIGGMAEDQTNRGCVPEDTDPQALGNVNSRDDYLAHRAEYFFPICYLLLL